MPNPKIPPPTVDIIIEDSRWNKLQLAELAPRACGAALRQAGAPQCAVEIALLACSDAKIAELNLAFRGRPAPTNVLSWPTARLAACPHPGDAPEGRPHLGDIAVAWETCCAEAEKLERPMAWHTAHLIVHGCLHLVGFSHETNTRAREMETLEKGALASIGIASPY